MNRTSIVVGAVVLVIFAGVAVAVWVALRAMERGASAERLAADAGPTGESPLRQVARTNDPTFYPEVPS